MLTAVNAGDYFHGFQWTFGLSPGAWSHSLLRGDFWEHASLSIQGASNAGVIVKGHGKALYLQVKQLPKCILVNFRQLVVCFTYLKSHRGRGRAKSFDRQQICWLQMLIGCIKAEGEATLRFQFWIHGLWEKLVIQPFRFPLLKCNSWSL